MLLSTNILNLERININVDEKKLLIRSCNDLITNIKIKVQNNIDVRRTIRNQKKITIFFNLIMRIFIELRISTFLSNKNYLFEFNYTKVYAHIVNVEVLFIYIKNDINIFKIVSRHFNLNIIIKYNVDLCLATHSSDYNLITKNRELRVNASKDSFDIKMNNDISMCNNENQIINLKTLITEYVNIWKDIDKIINISKYNLIRINLNIDWNFTSTLKFA